MFWDVFVNLCMEKEKSPTAVGLELGFSRATVSNWKAGGVPRETALRKIAAYFDVSTDDLLSNREFSLKPSKKETTARASGVRIPVVGKVAAGIPIEAIQDVDYDDPDGWEEISESLAETGNFFALKIHGNSMYPRIMDGDIAIVRCQDYFDNGDIVIVQIGSEEATCKKIKATPDGVTLISLNHEYDPMIYTRRQAAELPVKVIGKVVEVRGKL